jgi:magnesium transporter
MKPEVVSVHPEMDREELIRLAATHRYMAVPVVSAENRLLGIVRTGELIRAAEAEASEDLQKMFGAGGDESLRSPVPVSVRKRLPWLQINLATAFLAAAVVGLFQETLAAMSILAVFLPVVAGQAGNTGMQSLAVAIRGIALREVGPGGARRLLVKEAALGLLNGAAVALVTGLVVLAWTGNGGIASGTALAMLLSMLVAGVAGAGIPLAMRRLGLDPAQCSSIVLTTVTDVVGLASFIVLASRFAAFGS